MSETNTEARVREYITSTFLLAPGASLQRDASLITEGVIDSTGYLEVFKWLDDEFGIVVAEGEMNTDNFETVGHITAYIDRKLGAEGPR